VVRLARSPGEREQRWAHLLSGEVVVPVAATRVADTQDDLVRDVQRLAEEVAALRAEVAELRARLPDSD
jgi:uncharacterized protein YceH (UPF0502 family)